MSLEGSWAAEVDDPRKVHDLIALQRGEVPDVTVLIPVFNEQSNIVTCLHTVGVAAKNTQYKVEVLCANSASTDASPSLIDACGARRIDAPRGIGPATEAAMRSAESRYILKTDADTHVTPQWIDAHMRHYEQNPDTVGVAAKYRLDRVHPIYTAYFGGKDFIRRFIVKHPRISIAGITPTWMAGGNMSWDNEVFPDDDELWHLPYSHEDVYLADRMKETERPIAYDTSPENTVLTSGRRYRSGSQAWAAVWQNMKGTIRSKILRKGGKEYGDSWEDIRE